MLLLTVGAGLLLLTWSQTWFTLTVALPSTQSDQLAVSGAEAAPALSGFALASFALVAALSIAGKLFRKILASLAVALGVATATVSVAATSHPSAAALNVLVKLTGISNDLELAQLITGTSVSLAPWGAMGAGLLLILGGLLALLTSGRWSSGRSRKYDRASLDKGLAETNSAYRNVDSWDEMSNGGDPTIR